MPVARMPVDHRRAWAVQNSFKSFREQIDLSELVFELREIADSQQAFAETVRNKGPWYRAAVGAINGHLIGQLEDPAIVAKLYAEFRTQFPDIKVIKSTKFMNADGKPLKLYPTRGRKRGVLLIFSYYKFWGNQESYRNGVDCDCRMLDEVFSAIGFYVITCENFSKEDTEECLKRTTLEGYDCVFVIVSSHGSISRVSGKTQFRTADGGYMLVHEVVDYLNTDRRPGLKGVPKVFIFQMCRGDRRFPKVRRPATEAASDAASHAPGAAARECKLPARRYSDILIAYSTVPGYKSSRIGVQEQGPTWYMRALCDEFAGRAHEYDVVTLFTLVDMAQQKRFPEQTSVVENWGFNCHLYLNPGLF